MGKQRIDPETVGGSKTIAFFDVDNTLIRGACLYYLGIEAYRRKHISFTDILRFARKNLSFMAVGENKQHLSQVRERALSLLAGKSVSGVQKLIHVATQKRLMKQVFPQSIERLREHQARGDAIVLATAAPYPLAIEFAETLSVSQVIGTRLVAANGVYTGELQGPIAHADEKARRAAKIAGQHHIELSNCWAYSDSYNDLPLLSMVGHPVAVNPDRKLEQHAREHGWEILTINKTPALNERIFRAKAS